MQGLWRHAGTAVWASARRLIHTVSLVALAAALAGGCSGYFPNNKAVYVLLDTSGTYARQIHKSQTIINYLLSVLNPGDTLAVARIDSSSFSESDIIAAVTFDSRPSRSNAEKRVFHEVVDKFVRNVKGSAYTDISGALLQAITYLKSTQARQRYILIFSDMREELKAGETRDFDLRLDGIHVIALNVAKLNADSRHPQRYLRRLAEWKKRIETNGGTWQVLQDVGKLEEIFSLP